MLALTLADVIEGLTGHRPDISTPVHSFQIDSRQVEPGAVFVALPGEKTDGHLYVQQAFERGAIAAITHQPVEATAQTVTAEQPPANDAPMCIQVADSLKGLQQLARYWRQKMSPYVIGITGSVGKSTTKELVSTVLATRYHTLSTEGNLNNEIGLPLTLLKLTRQHERAVLEMGMYDVGEIALLAEISQPKVGLITNVGPSHLERLGTIERIAQAKSELVQALPPADDGGVAILNHDDERVLPMANLTQARVLTYGLSPDADLWASDVVSAGLEGIRFVFRYGSETIHAKLPLLGRHSVHTALRAALVGLVEGLDWEDIINGLKTLPNRAQLRLVAVPGPNQATILDDTYNASPASTIAALNLLDDLPAARKIAVLADMAELGSYEEEGHRIVGCRAAAIVDVLIVVGSRARLMAEEAAACGLDKSSIIQLANNLEATEYLKGILGAEDVVLVKGSNALKMDEVVTALTRQRPTKDI